MNKKNIAIFGGSFNPPINSHLNLAKQILEKNKEIEKIVFVPVSTKYKKQELADDIYRYNMLKILCDKEKNIEVSDLELTSKKQLYTIQTLNHFKKEYKENDIVFVMGADNLKELHTWKTPEKILSSFRVIVLERGEDKVEDIIKESKLLQKYESSIITIKGINKIPLSSTMIREKIKKGEDVEEFVDKDVLEYIKKNKLYK